MSQNAVATGQLRADIRRGYQENSWGGVYMARIFHFAGPFRSIDAIGRGAPFIKKTCPRRFTSTHSIIDLKPSSPNNERASSLCAFDLLADVAVGKGLHSR